MVNIIGHAAEIYTRIDAIMYHIDEHMRVPLEASRLINGGPWTPATLAYTYMLSLPKGMKIQTGPTQATIWSKGGSPNTPRVNIQIYGHAYL